MRNDKLVLLALCFLLIVSIAAGGFPLAVYGEQLKAVAIKGAAPTLRALPATAAFSVYGELAPVITDWEEFRRSFGSHNHALALEAGDNITIDGNMDEWAGYGEVRLPVADAQVLISGWGGPADVSASVYLTYDEDNFYWAAKVTDNAHTPVSDSTMWRGDSIQFAFSPGGTYGPEYGINYMDGQAHVWQFSEGGAAQGAEGITAAATQSGQDIFYEVRMPWTTISAAMPGNGELPFTLLFNDNDGAGRRGWIEWTPGIGKAKSPADHAVLHLVPSADPWSFWVEGPKEINVNSTVSFSVYAVNWTSEVRSFHLSSGLSGVEEDFTLPGGSVAEWTLPFSTAEPGEHQLEFTLTEQGAPAGKRQELKVTAVIAPVQIEAMLDAVNAELPGLEQLLLQCEAQGLSTDYERINYTVIKDFVGYGKEDIRQGRLGRAQYVAAGLETLFNEAQTQLEGYLDGSLTPQSAPRYVSGRPEISGYSFLGGTKVRSTGFTEERPIFFTGYGHFSQVKRDIPKLQDLGTNVIQMELGPRDVILDNKDFVNRYTVNRSGGVSATAAIVEGIGHSGNNSLKISNASPRQSNVFINVSQTLQVEPETTYEFKVWVKGDNANNVWFPGGTGWKQRKSFPAGTYDWREVSFEYTTAAGEVSYPLVILSENTGTVWLDDLSVVKSGSTVNLVQNPGFEDLGGYSAEKEYVVSTRKIESDLKPVLQRAEDYDVAVNLLISPHYFPDWALAKWPELKVANNGFIKFSLFRPMAKDIIEDYLRALIPVIKDYGSLQSLTLSNESVYQANKDPYALPAWREYLEEDYGGSIAQLNSVYGTAYASFAEVTMPDNVTASPLSYDYVLFNQDYFASWHEWMAGIIHELAPDLPVQAKIMGDPRGSLSWGVDIERFSQFSQINGNDNWNYINEGPKGFMEELSFYDLQASFKQAPIFNSEHHLIADGDKMYTPEQAKHVRSVLWQSAIHGRGGSAIWIWERTYNEAASAEGSILHRPDAVVQAGRTNLDLNRLAGQVTAFQNEQPQAAILYSTASGVFSGDYSAVSLRSYEALSYSGYKAGYVSEQQVEAGGLDSYKLLIVPNASRVNPATLGGIRLFMEQGGRVLLIGSHALELAPHGTPLSAADRSYVFAHADKIAAADWTASQIRDFLLPIQQNINPQQLMLLDPVDGEPVYGVEWRSVEYEGRTLVNVVNYGPNAVTVSIERNGARAVGFPDLITGESAAGQTIELQPLTPYLFSLDFPGCGD
ncbi:beta-galactosidase [Paenibacillus sp. 22594]|uniref:beta-galactosidase n=1 Tax=Paenibacillus sp. 22594 TaxID=3453947 RepID=UPI003F855F43